MSAAPPDPPGLAERLLRWLSPAGEGDVVADDLAEEFRNRAMHGIRAARRWYWRQVLTSAVPLLRWRGGVTVGADGTPDPGAASWRYLREDIGSAVRSSRRSPLISSVVVLTTVLGIGATTAVFSAANAILLRPLPFAGSERVVELDGVLRDGQRFPNLAYPDLADFRHDVHDFATLSVYSQNDVTLQHGADPRVVHAVQVDGEYARMFGLRTSAGRQVSSTDCVFGRPDVAVLSNGFWRREFGGDAAIVGKTVVLDNVPYQIVGVLSPDAYTYPSTGADVLLPLVIAPGSMGTHRGAMWAGAAARLVPGVSIAHARDELNLAAARLSRAYPDANSGIGAGIEWLHDAVVGPVRGMLILLMFTVGAVLLIACVNVANLLLVRSEARAREFALRSALGGTPGRLRRLVMTESLAMAVLGGSIGLLIATPLMHWLIAVYPEALPRADEVHIDWRVLCFGVAAVLLAGIVSGLPTAWRLQRLDLVRDLRDRSEGTGGRAGRRAGRALIVAQVATSLALLVAAGLLLQTFRGLTRVDPGFNPLSTTTFHLSPTAARHATGHDITQFYQAVTDSVARTPGVVSVATSTRLPFAPGGSFDVWIQEERGDQGPGKNPAGAIAVVSPGFAQALGVRVVAGRSFELSDDSASARVVMLNAFAARRFYPGTSPIGRYVRWGLGPHWRVVGVLASTHVSSLWDEQLPMLFAPAAQSPRWSRYVIVRSAQPVAALLASVRPALRSLDPTVAITDVSTMQDRITASLGPQRFRATLVGSLSSLALILAVVGLYGVVAYSVTQRSREIGIRMALGEHSAHVRLRIIGEALRLGGIGTVLGLALAWIASRWLAGFLVGVSAHDPRIFVAAGGLLLAVIALAADGPARRASRIDPAAALQSD